MTRSELKDEKLLELQRRLEERKEQRKREQEASKIAPDRKSSQRTRTLAQNKVSSKSCTAKPVMFIQVTSFWVMFVHDKFSTPNRNLHF